MCTDFVACVCFLKDIAKGTRAETGTHLVLSEPGGVRENHVLYFGWVVSGGEGEAPQGVVTGPVLADHRHDLLPDAGGEGNLVVSHPDVSTSLDNSLWGALVGTGREESVHEAENQAKKDLCALVGAYLDKHFAHGAVFGGAVHRHGLPVSGELQGEVLLHQLLDDLRSQMDGRGEGLLPSQLSGNVHTLQEGWRLSLTELQALARSIFDRLLTSVSKTFIFSTRQVNAVSVASPTFSYTPFT